MKTLSWVAFGLLLGLFTGSSLGEENTLVDSPKPMAASVPLKEANSEIPEASKVRVQKKKEEAVSVIRKTELRSVLESVYEKQQAYLSINRYEGINNASSNKNQGQLQIGLTRAREPTIHTIDKPLVLGGDGFGTPELEADDYRLHFTFNSHIKVPPIYENEKEDVGHLDPGLEKFRSEKFLIFHRSGSNFGRQIDLSEELKLGKPLKQKMISTKIEGVSETWIFFDQNKETKLHLIPSQKPLDLIYDDPANLKHDYQILNSGGS